MASSEALQMRILAASKAEGLCHDAIRSLGDLAENLEKPGKRLEEILAMLDLKNKGERERLRRMKDTLERGPYLD